MQQFKNCEHGFNKTILKELFKYNKNNNTNENVFDDELKNNIYNKSVLYDYKIKKTIPYKYFKHLYKEICHNKDIKIFLILFMIAKYKIIIVYILYLIFFMKI